MLGASRRRRAAKAFVARAANRKDTGKEKVVCMLASIKGDYTSNGIRENRPQSPERELLVAILHRALLDYTGNQATQRNEAQEWLFNGSDSGEPFSFNWVCSQLDLDSTAVRSQLDLYDDSWRPTPALRRIA